MTISAETPIIKVADYKMRLARFAPAAVTDGHFIYIIGGQSQLGICLRSIERFDVSAGTSEEFAQLHTGRCWHEAVLYRGKIYVLGGKSSSLPEDYLRSVEIVDLASRNVSAGVDMPLRRRSFGCVVVGNDLYVIGGEIYDGVRAATKSVQAYSFATHRWRDEIPIRQPRLAEAVCGTLGGRLTIIVPGGFDERPLKTIEAFDVLSRTWKWLPPLNYYISAYSLVAMEQSLLFFGDYSSPGGVFVHDLRSNTTEAFKLEFKSARDTAAVVVNGKVYVIGGKPDRLQQDARNLIQVYAPPPKPKPDPEARLPIP